jgi:hypothetical protein
VRIEQGLARGKGKAQVGFVDQLPTLIGVLLGAATSYFVTALTERANWRRRQVVRWDERRLAAYADYSNAVREKVLITSRIAATRGLNSNPEPLTADGAGFSLLDKAEARRAVLIETVRLLGDPKTMEAVHKLNRCVWHLEWIIRGHVAATALQWEQAFDAYAKARDEFIQCGRDSLRVPGSVTPPERLLPPWLHPVPQQGSTSVAPTTTQETTTEPA